MKSKLSLIMTPTVRRNVAGIIVAGMVCLACAGTLPAAEDDTNTVLRIGVTSDAFGNVNSNDASAALKAWAAGIQREQNVDGEFETKLLTNSIEEIRDFLRHGKFDGYGLTAAEFADMDYQPEYVYVGKRGEGLDLQYIVIAHAEGDIQSPKDLVGRELVTCDSNQMVMAIQWLETLMVEYAGGQKTEYPTMEKDLSKAILKVFFRQADAAVVTREAFDLAGELNPQLRKNIRVVCESPPLIPVIFVLKPASGNNNDMEILEKVLVDFDSTPGGRQVLTVIQSSSFEKEPLSVLDTTLQFLKDHERTVNEPIFMKVQ